MYPPTLGVEKAIQRIETLIKGGFYSESLVTSVFTVEKMLRRTLRQIIVSAGFTSKDADQILSRTGLQDIKTKWAIYEPNHKTLIEVIGQDVWKEINASAQMRNKLVHGVRTYKDEDCQKHTEITLDTIAKVKQRFDERYGYSGWSRFSVRRTSKLHFDPKVKIRKPEK